MESLLLAFAEPVGSLPFLDFYLQKAEAVLYILTLVFAESLSLNLESVTFGRNGNST